MLIGQTVKVRVFGGEEADLIVVQENSTHVNVCTQKELAKAKKEKRQPMLVGFQIGYVITNKE
jgi:hypothetical protein